jgi:hypothetical protein
LCPPSSPDWHPKRSPYQGSRIFVTGGWVIAWQMLANFFLFLARRACIIIILILHIGYSFDLLLLYYTIILIDDYIYIYIISFWKLIYNVNN